MDGQELLRRKAPRVRTVQLLLSEGTTVERDRLLVEISRQEMQEEWDGGDMKSPLPRLRKELEEADQLIRDDTVTITFSALPRTRWLVLVDELCEDDGEITEAFAKAIVLESATDPKFAPDDIDEIWDTWSSAETDLLYLEAWKVNREVRDIPFTSDGIEQILSSVSSLTTAPNEE